MRIAILGSVALPIPPLMQGGTEWIAYYQALGLANLNHKILLFGAKGTAKNFSHPNIKVIEIGEGDLVSGSSQQMKIDPSVMEGSRVLRKENVYLAEVLQMLISMQDEYDIILNNMRGEAVFVSVASLINKPFVSVMHLNLFQELADFFQENKTNIITISNAQKKQFPNLNYVGTVYNCVDTDKFSFSDKNNDYLLMVGSIGRHKNQFDAIFAAKKLGVRLILAGKIRDQDYFDELKKNIDGNKIQWIGEMKFTQKVKLYQNAKAFLFPINWEEPFGLVMIEAMSCGTPVIAYNHGAISEVVVNNKTGFVVENKEQMVESFLKINLIKREDCRKHVVDNFSIEKMVGKYEKILLSL